MHVGHFLTNIQMDRIGPSLQKNWTKSVDDIKDTDTCCQLLIELTYLLGASNVGDVEYRSVVELGRRLAERVPFEIKQINAGRKVSVDPDMFFRL